MATSNGRDRRAPPWLRIAFSCLCLTSYAGAGEKGLRLFEAKIRPVLVEHCYPCHSAASPEIKGELRLDYRDGLRQGGGSGPAVIPGKPEDSLLLKALRHDVLEMPPDRQLPDSVIATFERWIRSGAVDPRDHAPSPAEAASSTWKAQLAQRSHWWSLQPPRNVRPPAVGDDAWSREPVDRFIRRALDRAHLAPARPARAEIVLRRIAFVLTGLPPKVAQVKRFPRAYAEDPDRALARLADELLASPHFGERFARHWMDVVRYTDTYGYEWDNPAKGSWEYRDYLIRAFNSDVGFDQLIREQIAGDLLPEPRINRQEGVNESMIGPMFYHMGEHRHGDSVIFNGVHQEMINNKIDAFSQAFLAMTVACARCHDHKLDAISQADYYALAGVFMSPRWTARCIEAPGTHDAAIAALRRLRGEIEQRLRTFWSAEARVLRSGASLERWARAHRASLGGATIDDVAWPFAQLLGAQSGSAKAAPEADAAGAWRRMRAAWRTAHAARRSENARRFTVLSDFRRPGFPEGWVVEGDGIAHGYVRDGTPLVSLTGETLVDRLLPRGYHTHALSSKLAGAVRLPAQDATRGKRISLELQGGEWAGFMIVPQNAFQTETLTFLDATRPPTWTTIADLDLKPEHGITRVLPEVMTASLHPNFPPRTGLARAGKIKLSPEDDGLSKRSWFSLTGIVAHDVPGVPQDPLEHFAPLFDAAPATTSDEAWQRIAAWLSDAVDRWSAGRATSGDVRLLNWLLDQRLLPNRLQDAPDIAPRVRQYRRIEAGIAFPRSAMGMDERGARPIDYRLDVRGDVYHHGPAVRRNFLEVFAGQHQVGESEGSGRRELAEYLGSRHNPQTARVYVNRIWQAVFGRGLVATPNDFGKLGARPSHPELLDWLANRFMEEGWSTKRLVRRLVLSRTFRQAGRVTPAAFERDPDNRLLHHYPTRRLEAEAIRDNLLAVSGRLDARLFGPPINPPRLVEDAQKRLFSGPLDSDGRRSLYMKMSIMDPPKFLVCFNLPDLKLPTGRRDVTNTPAHALALLNHPLVVQLSEWWAAELITDGRGTPEARIDAMFVRGLGRHPTPVERRRWTGAIRAFSHAPDIMNDASAWSELAHLLFNMKEFIYYR